MDESRKQFEAEVFRRAEVSGYAHMSSVLKKTSDGGYATTWVDMMWEGWQASRAAIEIELPEAELVYSTATDTYGEDGCLMLPVETIARVLNDAGIKVKE